jgi:hypothetical protein
MKLTNIILHDGQIIEPSKLVYISIYTHLLQHMLTGYINGSIYLLLIKYLI